MAELSDQIHSALNDHLADEGGGMVTAFHLIAEYVDDQGEHCWMYTTAEDQRQSVTMGLIAYAQGVAQHEQQAYLDRISDDD